MFQEELGEANWIWKCRESKTYHAPQAVIKRESSASAWETEIFLPKAAASIPLPCQGNEAPATTQNDPKMAKKALAKRLRAKDYAQRAPIGYLKDSCFLSSQKKHMRACVSA